MSFAKTLSLCATVAAVAFSGAAAHAGTATANPAQYLTSAIIDNTTAFVGSPVTYTTQVQLAPGTYYLYISLSVGDFILPTTVGSPNPTSNNATLNAALQAANATYYNSNLGLMIYPFTVAATVPSNSTITFMPTSGNWTAVDNLASLKGGGSVAAFISIGSSKGALSLADVDSAAGGNILTFIPWTTLVPKPAVSAGNSHTLALKNDGTLRAWGSDSFGQLGIGTQISVPAPVQIGGLSGAMVDVEAGDGFNLSLGADGSVWAWGFNAFGQLGDGTIDDNPTPQQVRGLTGVTQIVVGEDFSLALKSDGTVWAWGANFDGALGDGTTIQRSLPVQVAGLTGVSSISAGLAFSVALKDDGTVWAWGANDSGQLGDGTQTNRYLPVQVMSLTNIRAVSAGQEHALALGSSGIVWAWGDNGNSQLGDGTTVTRLTPVPVTGLANVTGISGGGFFSLALTSGGQVYGWGSNLFGALGDGTTTQRSTPVAAQISGVALVVAGEEHAMALKTDGTVWAWGENGSGQLGDGTTQDRHSPVQVTGFANAAAISAGYEHSAAVKTDGSVWAWGNNSTGELGFGVTDNRSTPQTIPSFANVVAIAAGGEHSVALAGDGSVWTWGSNEAKGQLGDGTTTSRSSPEQVPGLGAVVGIAANMYHTVAVKADGSVWAWGYNDDGALGDGTYVNRFSPVQVTGLGNIVAVSAGTYFTLALRADGSVWSWGNNAYGQLGNGTTVGNNSPSQVTGLSNVVAIAAGSYHSLALKSDGSVWGWGNDYDGRLGDGATLVNRLTPIQAIGIGNVVAISAGVFDSLALRSDGTVWSWGDNSNGNLGDGTTTNRSTPVQVSGLSGVAGIAAGKFGNRTTYYSMAVKTDGTVVGWGDNFTGQLGDGTYAQRLTPEIVLRENGAGSLQTADWFLDLAPGTAKNIPAGEIPAFEMIGTASGSDSSRTVSATVAYNPADLGKTGSVFITARVPAGSFPGESNRTMTFGTSQQTANALAGGPKPRMRTTAAPGTTYTQYQLTPSGWQPVVNGQLIPYVTGVLGSQLAAQTILSNTDTTAIPGAEFCLGYGSSASAMIANGTVRSVVSVAGAPVGTVVSCLPGSTGGVFPQSGYWWNPAEAGRGYVIEYNGTNVFMAAFLYDQSGRSTWYGGGPAPLTGSTFTAPMSAYSGGQTLTGSYRSAAQGTSPGNISITFSDATDGTLTWPGGTIPITRYPFATNGLSSPPTATQPQTGWWWNPSEGGRGFSIEIQDNTAFVAAYMYDASGNPVWYAAGPATLSSGNVYQGSWTSYAGGQTLTGSYQSPTSTTNAGSLTIQFSSPTAGTLTLPDGQQIPIERFGF